MNSTATQSQADLSQRLLAILIGAIGSFFYLYDFIVRVMPEAMTGNLMATFQIAAGGLGLLSALFFYGYALMQIPAGMLYDRFSPRLLLTLNLSACALATAAFSLTNHYSLSLIARFIMGFTASFAYLGALKIGSNWFAPRYFAFYTGLVQFLGCIGAIIGVGPIAALAIDYGWREAGLLIAITGIIFALFIWLVVRDKPAQNSNNTPIKIAPTKVTNARVVFKNPQTWWIALFGFAIWAPVVIIATLWGAPFLQQAYNLSSVHAATMVTFIWIGIAVGGPTIGWWSNFIKKRCMPMALAATLGCICSSIILYVNHLQLPLLSLLLFFFGLASSAQVLCFGLVIDVNRKSNIGTASGFTNMAVILAGVVLQPIVGFIIQHLWNGQTDADGVAIYSVHAYQMALIMVPICFLLALIITLFLIKETHCKRLKT